MKGRTWFQWPARAVCALAMGMTALSVVVASGGGGAAGSGGFRLEATSDASLGIWEGDRPVLVYNHGVIRREGVPSRYDRASYIHPLHGVDGEVLTEDFPKDHYHHRGLFWGWPHVAVGGKEYESWVPGTLAIRFERWLRREARPDRAVLALENGWYAGEERVATETLEIVIHAAKEGSRSIDLAFTWTAAERPVTLRGAEGKSYGGLTLRYAPREDTAITVPSGKTERDLAVERLRWADLTARFKEAPGRSGASIFIAPSHPDFPPTWLTRHYGVLCVGWPGVEPGTLEPGRPVRCAYRVWVHRGDASPGEIEKAYREYAESAGRG